MPSMVVDISNLTEKRPVSFNLTKAIDLKGNNLQQNSTELILVGNISKNGDVFVCNARADAVLSFMCDFCLEPVSIDLSFSVEERFKGPSAEEEDISWTNQNQIDLYQLCITNLYKHIPMQVLCNPTCKGLCPNCGNNLNNNDCNCDNNDHVTDPRFNVLKNLKF